jgi:hypothetical protein
MPLSANHYVNAIAGLQELSPAANPAASQLNLHTQHDFEKMVQQVLLEQLSKQIVKGFFNNEDSQYGMLLSSVMGNVFTASNHTNETKEGGI